MRKNLTEIVFILDRSGSMSGLEADTIGGFNSRYECKSDNHREPVNSHVPLSNSAPFLEAILGL